ncbi:MAG: chromosomal replication initiator protein DnaA [Fimbriimonadales bacterium]|nr:chromosomal replication initiator protein DnaA [Fimbriimonadales bacterium]
MQRREERAVEQLRLGEGEVQVQLRRAWRNVLQALLPHVAISSQRYLEAVEPLDVEGDLVRLRLDNAFGRQWIAHRLRHEIESLLTQQLGFPVRVELVGEEGALTEVPQTQAVAQLIEPVPAAPPLPPPRFNRDYTFETFIVGRSNRLAHGAAQAIVDAPGKRYNPLFIYSLPGLGKTHLLHAIGQAFLTRFPQARVLYLSGEEFLRRYVQAVRQGQADEFRELHRSVHLWLVDDVQFIAGRERTQEEFFHIFNTLFTTERPIALTSDKPPRELLGLEERLRSRFEQGLCADIVPPDFELRVAILLAKAEREGVRLPMEIAEFIADKVQSNVRALEGALTRLIAHSSLHREPLTLETAAEVLRTFFVDAKPQPVTVQRVLEVVCHEFGINQQELTGRSRRGDIVPIRQIAMYAARDLTGEPWARIAQAFGRNDHTTVLHAYQQVSRRLPRDPHLRARIEAIRRRLGCTE